MKRGLAGWVGFGLLFGGCIFQDDSPRPNPHQECRTHEDCAYLDDGDACFSAPRCVQERCERLFLQDAEACKCEYPGHCEAFGFVEQGCNIVTCLSHQCGEQIMPEGPSIDQPAGDCSLVRCDGVNALGSEEVDLSDIDDDHNPCTVDSCSEEGPVSEPLADGDICIDDSGICYAGSCHAGCVPDNPEACGSEGPSEPSNNLPGTATDLSRHSEVCGMLDGEDIDWFRMYLEDEDFVHDIVGFELRSSAATVELCAYVRCDNHYDGGVAEGAGCSDKLPGPQGSVGCCWQGAPASLSPTWDMDCTGTSDDSGTMYFSLRALGGDLCETYVVSAHY